MNNLIPSLAIIGRPNVGKSSLFNRFLKERVAIEEPTEGVTRDRLICETQINGKAVHLIDTGGIGVVDRQHLEGDVDEQIEFAIASADLVLFVVDAQNDITELDRKVCKKLHQTHLEVILAANKTDNETLEMELSRFAALGFGEPIAISVLHNKGIKELIETVSRKLPNVKAQKKDDQAISLALAGRRNVGKSSLTNYLCGEKRVIVSDMAGTTRDAIDVRIQVGDQEYVIIDTAGLRKKSQTEDSIEFFSVNRTFGALYRSQFGILMLDATRGISQVDQKLGRWMADQFKPCLIVVNKWDLAEEENIDFATYQNYVRRRMPGLAYAPMVTISAKTGQGVDHLFEALLKMKMQVSGEIGTPLINQILHEAQQKKMPRKSKGAVPKLYYGTCIKSLPPTFLIFGKCTNRISDNYKRYLANFFRDQLKMPYLPVRLVFKKRDSLYKDKKKA